MKLATHIILTLGIIGGMALPLTAPLASAQGTDPLNTACSSASASNSPLCQNRTTDRVTPFIKTLVNALLFVIGAVSVVVIIISGIFYLTSMGDSTAIAKAKNTLLYAIIGLVVALLAYPIANFVITSLN